MMRSTFAIPAIIAALSLIGLISALTGDGARDAISWVTLAVPVLTAGWAWLAARRRNPRPARFRAAIPERVSK